MKLIVITIVKPNTIRRLVTKLPLDLWYFVTYYQKDFILSVGVHSHAQLKISTNDK